MATDGGAERGGGRSRRSRASGVAVGAVVGTGARWALATSAVGSFPWWTLLANVAGCALLAALLRRAPDHPWRDAVGVGFCGGLTTLSTFAVEATELLGERPALGATYLVASVAGGLGAAWWGWWWGGRRPSRRGAAC